ncbi:MAG: short-chain dehydrogenase, partial [Asticcacaulis sp. 32-58-5]
MSDLKPTTALPPEAFNPLSLTGRTVMVTGASSGIGRATAIYLSKLGARIIATGRDESRLQVTLDALPGAGHVGRVMDLSLSEAIVPWMKDTCATYGPLDGLAHCAGIQSMRPLQMVTVGYVQEILNANLVAAIALAQGFRLKACHNPGAALVLVSSTAALKGAAGNSVYAASKGAIISLTRSLGLELLRDKIRVN